MKKLISLILALALCLALAAPAMAIQDEDELFEPLEWFGNWPDDGELIDWDFYEDDENASALLLYFVTEPQTGVDLFQIYTDQLNECDDLRCIAEKQFDSGFSGSDNDTDREILYRYTGKEDVGTVTALQSGKNCDFAVHQVWLDGDYLVLILAWGENFPIEVDPDGSDETGASDRDSGGIILPDAWAFFNEEVNHTDSIVTNGRATYFSLIPEDSAACYEYIDLLMSDRFGFTLTDTMEKSYGRFGKTTYYFFDYPGIEEEKVVTKTVDDREVAAALTVQIQDWSSWCEMFIRFSDALTVTDTGDRCTVTGLEEWSAQDSDGPMGSAVSQPDSTSYEEPDVTARPSETSSDGHWEWQTVEKDCPSCVGGTCPICDGTGTYHLYGQSVSCPRDCTACDGRGSYTQEVYVFVHD